MAVSLAVKQVFYSSAGLLNYLMMGFQIGFPASLTPALTRGDGRIRADIDQAAWISSAPGVSGFILAITIGPLTHYFGRRLPHIGTNVLILIGWTVTSRAETVWALALGVGLHGLGAGLMSFYSIIIAEYTCPRIRGSVLLLKTVSVSSGVFLTHCLGSLFHWRTVALVPLLPGTVSIAILLLSPDTPDWLVSVNRFDEAEEVFYELRGQSKESERQIRELVDAQKGKLESRSVESRWRVLLKKLRSKSLWRPLALMFCCNLVPGAGGRNFFPSYSVQLVEQITGDKSNGHVYTICLDIIAIACTVTSYFLTKRFNRRFMLLTCGYVATAIYLIACLLMYLKSDDSKGLMRASVVFLALYIIIVYTTVFGTCYALLGELLPLDYRPIGLVFNGLTSGVAPSIFVKLLPIFQRWFGIHGMLASFCGVMLVGLLYIDYEMPETKDRTLHDIGEYFRGKSPKVRNETDEYFCREETTALNVTSET